MKNEEKKKGKEKREKEMKKRMRIRKGRKKRGYKMHRGWEEEKERIIEKKGRNVTERRDYERE